MIPVYLAGIMTPYTPDIIALPFPQDFEDEPLGTMLDRANALCATAEQITALLNATGQPLPYASPEDRDDAALAFASRNVSTIHTNPAALVLTGYLTAYDHQIVTNAQQLRNFVTNNLIELASPGNKASDRIRASELLGKIKDVGLFEERSAVVVEHLSSDDIKTRLKDKFNRIKQAGVLDVQATEVKP